jgi:hypothetical protein
VIACHCLTCCQASGCETDDVMSAGLAVRLLPLPSCAVLGGLQMHDRQTGMSCQLVSLQLRNHASHMAQLSDTNL